MSRKPEIVDIEADLIHETDLAYLLCSENGEEVWVPKSIVDYDPEDGTFTMPRHFAERKGLV